MRLLNLFVAFAISASGGLSIADTSTGTKELLRISKPGSEWNCYYTSKSILPYAKHSLHGKSFNLALNDVRCDNPRTSEWKTFNIACRSDVTGVPAVYDCVSQRRNDSTTEWRGYDLRTMSKDELAKPVDGSQLDQYGRKCTYLGDPTVLTRNFPDKAFEAFCVTPMKCEGGSEAAPKRKFAACLPNDTDGKPNPDGEYLDKCPAVVDCLKNEVELLPAQSQPPQVAQADKKAEPQPRNSTTKRVSTPSNTTGGSGGHVRRGP